MFWHRNSRVYDDLRSDIVTLREDRAGATAMCNVLRAQVEQQNGTIAFLCARLNQVERERLALMKAATRIADLPDAPEFRATAPVNQAGIRDAYSEASTLFDDMGDARAREHGVAWDKDGHVVYAERPAAPTSGRVS